MLPYLKMFPEPVEVFADRVEEHAKFLFPLFSLELNHVNPTWTGQIHMLQFNEDPYNTGTVNAFTDYCKDCMIGFDIINGKYSFKTGFNYFDMTPDWVEWFEMTKSSFAKTKQDFIKTGIFRSPKGDAGEIFEQIGGEPKWVQSDETPIDPDGGTMAFIAHVYSGNYTRDYCDKDIYLFYNDKHKLAVFVYQTT